jgi:hypothetical protein
MAGGVRSDAFARSWLEAFPCFGMKSMTEAESPLFGMSPPMPSRDLNAPWVARALLDLVEDPFAQVPGAVQMRADADTHEAIGAGGV